MWGTRKKVAYLAWLGTNYGSMLQALALFSTISSLGYRCLVVGHGHFSSRKRLPPASLREQDPKRYDSWLMESLFRDFSRRHFRFCRSLRDLPASCLITPALSRALRSFDAFVCGSDQIWKPAGFWFHPLQYLRFAPAPRRVAYAPSVGWKKIPQAHEQRIELWKRYLSGVACLSCREESGSEIIRSLTGRTVETVVDPTMLLTPEQWLHKLPRPVFTPEIRQILDSRKPFVLAYLLDSLETYREYISSFARERGLEVVWLAGRVNTGPVQLNCAGTDPAGFVHLVSRAAFVFADGFHGICFSVNFSREFAYLLPRGNFEESNDSRLWDLFRRFGISGRVITPEDLAGNGELFRKDFPPLDHPEIRQKVDQQRRSSLEYLTGALQSAVRGSGDLHRRLQEEVSLLLDEPVRFSDPRILFQDLVPAFSFEDPKLWKTCTLAQAEAESRKDRKPHGEPEEKTGTAPEKDPEKSPVATQEKKPEEGAVAVPGPKPENMSGAAPGLDPAEAALCCISTVTDKNRPRRYALAPLSVPVIKNGTYRLTVSLRFRTLGKLLHLSLFNPADRSLQTVFSIKVTPEKQGVWLTEKAEFDAGISAGFLMVGASQFLGPDRYLCIRSVTLESCDPDSRRMSLEAVAASATADGEQSPDQAEAASGTSMNGKKTDTGAVTVTNTDPGTAKDPGKTEGKAHGKGSDKEPVKGLGLVQEQNPGKDHAPGKARRDDRPAADPKLFPHSAEELRKIRQPVTAVLERGHCCGCGACVNACPRKALSWSRDPWGYYVPRIDMSLCNSCGLCVRLCPSLSLPPASPRRKPQLLAFSARDPDLLRQSSSGGIASLLAEQILQRGGAVAGCAWQEKDGAWTPVAEHILVEDPAQLPRLRKSKYIQSRMGDIYPRVQELLQQGRQVLFTGCPCQVAGLKKFLKKDYANLYLVDLLCGNSPSQEFFQRYLEETFDRPVTSYTFRARDPGSWISHTCHASFAGGETREIPRKGDPFQEAYHPHILMPLHCEKCRFQAIPRFGDLTIGDFWGITAREPALSTVSGISAVLVNSPRGEELLSAVPREKIAIMEEKPLAWLGSNGAAIRGAHTWASPGRDAFYQEIRTSTFQEALDAAQKVNQGQSPEEFSGPCLLEGKKMSLTVTGGRTGKKKLLNRILSSVGGLVGRMIRKDSGGSPQHLALSAPTVPGKDHVLIGRCQIMGNHRGARLYLTNEQGDRQNLHRIPSPKNAKGTSGKEITLAVRFTARGAFTLLGAEALGKEPKGRSDATEIIFEQVFLAGCGTYLDGMETTEQEQERKLEQDQELGPVPEESAAGRKEEIASSETGEQTS